MRTGAAMRRLLLLLGALACLLPPAGAAATLAATLIIDRSSAPMPILSPGRLFGSFFEDFLHAADGGIYAEKLANRALAQPLANASAGMICTGGQGTGPCTWSVESGTAARDASAPLSAAVPHGLWLSAGSVVSNSGFPGGIAVSAGESLSLSLFVLVRSGPVSLEARIVDTATGGMLGSASLLASAPAGVAWRVVKVPLTALQDGPWELRRVRRRVAGRGKAHVRDDVVAHRAASTRGARAPHRRASAEYRIAPHVESPVTCAHSLFKKRRGRPGRRDSSRIRSLSLR